MIKENKAYEIVQQVKLDELNAEGFLLKHKKTGARIALIPCEDNNKTFCVGFKTPPADDTGVPHIVEHTVLCGSKKFNVKDPFMELVKGSLNTFLNAMTYADKTVYPVASTNDADFHNLVDVYMDAVFNPNIYKHEEIFKQEGWSYNLESADDKITYNGVVYNEMKGAFSSPDDVLERQIMHSLYPDTCYANESGGAPASIPDLTYEQYLDFHRTYYHPSNCYIYLYGDMNMDEYLEWFDSEYLSGYDYLDVDSEIKLQKPFEQTITEKASYSITENESEEDNTYLSYNCVTGVAGDKIEYMAFKVLDYALCAMPGAPVKQALIDAGIGKDIYSSYAECMFQPYYSIVAKNANESDKENFIKIIKDTLLKLVKDGIDKESLEAGINVFEFQTREADFGSYPKGLMYGLQMYDSWLYDDNKPFIHLQSNETFEVLKKKINEGYFEQLIEKTLLNNPHSSIVIVNPVKGLTAKMEKELEDKLAEYKAGLSEEEIKKLVEDTKALERYKDEPSDEEEIKKIPLLQVSDIRKEVEKFDNEIEEVDGTTYVKHNVFTNQIAYINFMFEITELPEKVMPYLGLIKTVLGYIDTETMTYSEIANQVNKNSGGIGFDISIHSDFVEQDKYRIFADFKARVMYDKIDFAFDIIEKIINTTIYEDEKRIFEILLEIKSRLEMNLNHSGHMAATLRSQASISKTASLTENLKGINYFYFVDDLIKNYDKKKDTLIEELKKITKYMFRQDNLLMSCTAGEDGLNITKKYICEFKAKLATDKTLDLSKIEASKEIEKNEGFKTSAQIQYVVQTGNFKKYGFEYSGYVRVMSTILNYEYLWNMVRVQGGAYGCSSSFTRLGNAGFSSYRDPNLQKTFENYEKAPEYLANIKLSEREMTKFIIGTISGMDTPLTPSARGRRSMNAYLCNVDIDTLQKERDEVLGTKEEDIRNLAPLVKAVLDDKNICVIGNESKIDEAKELFLVTKNLFS